MTAEEVAHRLAQRAGALAVNQSHAGEPRQERGVQISLDRVARLVGRFAKKENLRRDRAEGLGGHAAGARARADGGSPARDPEDLAADPEVPGADGAARRGGG